jgi:hypothetical protein
MIQRKKKAAYIKGEATTYEKCLRIIIGACKA